MNKYYFFLANGDIEREGPLDALDGLASPMTSPTFLPEKGYLLADEKFAVMLQGIVLMIHDDIGVTISFLAAHKGGPLEEKAPQGSLGLFPQSVPFPQRCPDEGILLWRFLFFALCFRRIQRRAP
jgi:hypothetical protein